MLSNLISESNGCLEHVSRSSTVQSGSSQFQPTGAMSVSPDKPTRPEYASHLFLNREAEVTRFKGLLDEVTRGVAGFRRVLVFEGERGVGKSWLLKHMHRLAAQQTGAVSYLVRFDPQYDGTLRVTANKPEAEVTIACKLNNFTARPDQLDEHSKHQLKELLANIAAHVHTEGLITEKLPTALTLDETSFTLARMLRTGLQNSNRVFVLLVDSAYEADWSFVAGLEDYVLAPLVAIDRVAVVLSGRGRPFPWINSLLRIEPMQGAFQRWGEQEGASEIHGKHWDWTVRLVQTQVHNNDFWQPIIAFERGETLNPVLEARLKKIWRVAQGQPLLTVRLAENTESDGGANDSGILDKFIDNELLDMLPDNQRTDYRKYLEALCVLDFFRETEAEIMIRKYFELNGQVPGIKSGREVLLLLQQTYLVRWDWRKSQYLLDDTVRIAIDSWFSLAAPEQWRELHREAYAMYSLWAERYSQHAGYYSERAARHTRFLAKAANPDSTERQQTEVVG